MYITGVSRFYLNMYKYISFIYGYHDINTIMQLIINEEEITLQIKSNKNHPFHS